MDTRPKASPDTPKNSFRLSSVGKALEMEQNKIKDRVYFYIHSQAQFIGKKKKAIIVQFFVSKVFLFNMFLLRAYFLISVFIYFLFQAVIKH